MNILKSDIQEKEDEIKLLERSVLELEGTVDALESQVSIHMQIAIYLSIYCE